MARSAATSELVSTVGLGGGKTSLGTRQSTVTMWAMTPPAPADTAATETTACSVLHSQVHSKSVQSSMQVGQELDQVAVQDLVGEMSMELDGGHHAPPPTALSIERRHTQNAP